MTDLIVLVPDKDIEQSIRGVLNRPEALGIRPISFEVIVHPGRDPGCYDSGVDLLDVYVGQAEHALILFDAAWDGAPSGDPQVLMADVANRMNRNWDSRGTCVVIDPEIEGWVWSDSPQVAEVLGWRGREPSLRRWLADRGLWEEGHAKPADPKEAFERCLREVRVKPSSALFAKLAGKVSLRRCTDTAFDQLLETLRRWFAGG